VVITSVSPLSELPNVVGGGAVVLSSSAESGIVVADVVCGSPVVAGVSLSNPHPNAATQARLHL
jgi:hypothetical protein